MITAIIQARMGSTRLPDKTLMEIEGKPLLWHLIERVKRAKLVDRVVIATTLNPRDKEIWNFAKKHGIEVYRGSEDDVLDRVYQVAKKVKARDIVRVTPDCPLLCPKVVDEVVSEYIKGGSDYVTNTLTYTYPDGLDVEVFSFKALEKAWKECKDAMGREHLTLYIRNSGKFSLKNIERRVPLDPAEYKWSVDRAEDLKFAREVFKRLFRKDAVFSSEKVLDLLRKHPEIKDINSNAMINEGYYRSILQAPAIKPKRINIKRSLDLKRKAERLIPDCSQTFSKGPSQYVQGVSPVFLEKGKGCRVWDVDGNEYIDYAMALGPIILGHSYPRVVRDVEKALEKSTTFTLPHRMEVELAEALCRLIPCAEMVRFGKNGSDVTSSAVRLARAYTGREKVACCGYHGWQDWYIATTTRSKGIPEGVKKLTLTFEYNRIETLEKLFKAHKGQIACVIMEPVGVVEPEKGFLKEVKRLTHENGALLVFDEIVTGFRFDMGGAQKYFGVIPDLACFGKAMGNGFPIAAVVGRRKIMKMFEEVFYSFTFGGEIMSIAAALATISEMEEKNVIHHIWELGRKVKDGYNLFAREYGLDKYTQCVGYPPRTVITFRDTKGRDDLLLKSLFQQECVRRGLLFLGVHDICFSHTDKDIDYTLKVYRTVFEIVKDAVEKGKVRKLIEGEPVKPIFRKA